MLTIWWHLTIQDYRNEPKDATQYDTKLTIKSRSVFYSGRGLRGLYRWVAQRLHRWIGPRAVRAVAWIVVAGVVYLVNAGLLFVAGEAWGPSAANTA